MLGAVQPAQAALLHAQRAIAEADAKLSRVAKKDPAMFAWYVLRDERTGQRIRLSPMHEAWHRLMSEHPRLLVWGHVESGKTQQVAVARLLWEVGRDPSIRACLLSNTHTQAAKLLQAAARHVETSRALRKVFPDLLPSEPWTASSFTVKRKTVSKDPTVQAIGVHGNILGARLDLVVVDDILDFENTLTPSARQGLWEWFNATVMGRLTANAKVIVIGNAHHPDDLMHRFAASPGWAAYRYPVVDDDGKPRWPERWPMERVERARQAMTPIEFARQLLCVARDDASSRFKQEWLDVCLRRGEGKETCHALGATPLGCRVYTGVDLAVQQHSTADLTVFFTVVVHPNGDREVLNVESGRWTGPEIVQRAFDVHHRYQSILIVENNAAQDFILQFAAHRGAIPVKPFTTGRNKAHPEFGVESLATELMQGKWIIPNRGGVTDKEVGAWLQEMIHYDPNAHTGDRLMASWFAREGFRLANVGTAGTFRINLSAR